MWELRVGVCLLAGGLALGCQSSAADIAEQAAKQDAESMERARASNAARATKVAADASAVATIEHVGQAACKKLADETRACQAGKFCNQADPSDARACMHYMQANGLDRNPF